LGFALLAVVAVLVFCAFWLAASCERFRKARDFNMFNLCYKCRVLFVTLTLACGGLFPMLGVVNVMGPHFLELGGFVGLAYCSVVTVYGVKRCKDETRIRRLFDAGSEPTVTQATKNPAFQPSDKTSLLSLKRLVRRQATSEAQQSDRSPGTISSQQMNGPCVSIPSVEAAASQTPTTVETGVQWWIRTPDGKQSGPHSKEQLIKAVVAGRVPQGTVTANAPSGPWKQLQLRKQT